MVSVMFFHALLPLRLKWNLKVFTEAVVAARITHLGKMSARKKMSSLLCSSSQIDAHGALLILFSECCLHFSNSDENNSSNEIHWCSYVFEMTNIEQFLLAVENDWKTLRLRRTGDNALNRFDMYARKWFHLIKSLNVTNWNCCRIYLTALPM